MTNESAGNFRSQILKRDSLCVRKGDSLRMLGTLVLLAGVASAQFGYSQDELDLFDLVEEVGVQETL